jgi:hypothetical protein
MDTIGQRLARGEAAIARIRLAQMTPIREADRRQAPMADGCPSMVEWVTGRLDVAPETATTLVSTTRRLKGLPVVAAGIAEGSVGFDRAAAIVRIANPSEDGEILDELASYDVAGIQRLVAYRRRTRYADARWAMGLDSPAGGDRTSVESAAPLATEFDPSSPPRRRRFLRPAIHGPPR